MNYLWPHDKLEELYSRSTDELQGDWVNEATKESMGRIEGILFVWHPSYEAPPTELRAADGGTIDMELSGKKYRAVVDNSGPRSRLRWSDGELWIRVRSEGSLNVASSSSAVPAAPSNELPSAPVVPKGTVGVLITRKRARGAETLRSQQLFARADKLREREEEQPASLDGGPEAQHPISTSPTMTEEVSSGEFRANDIPALMEEFRRTLVEEIPTGFRFPPDALARIRGESDELSRIANLAAGG